MKARSEDSGESKSVAPPMMDAIAPEPSFSVAKPTMTANEARLERKRIKREKEEAAKLEELTRIRKAHFEENRYGLFSKKCCNIYCYSSLLLESANIATKN